MVSLFYFQYLLFRSPNLLQIKIQRKIYKTRNKTIIFIKNFFIILYKYQIQISPDKPESFLSRKVYKKQPKTLPTVHCEIYSKYINKFYSEIFFNKPQLYLHIIYINRISLLLFKSIGEKVTVFSILKYINCK